MNTHPLASLPSDRKQLRAWFATFAPEPDEADFKFAFEQDRMADPHNDWNRRRDRPQIWAQYKLRYADAMIAELEKT